VEVGVKFGERVKRSLEVHPKQEGNFVLMSMNISRAGTTSKEDYTSMVQGEGVQERVVQGFVGQTGGGGPLSSSQNGGYQGTIVPLTKSTAFPPLLLRVIHLLVPGVHLLP